jgi:hypothetical protein
MLEKAWCVFWFTETKSIITLQRWYHREFNKSLPSKKSLYKWHEQFVKIGCPCSSKSNGQMRVDDVTVEHVRQLFIQSPEKSTVHICHELQMSQPTVWWIAK